jgi:hypothetical protein
LDLFAAAGGEGMGEDGDVLVGCEEVGEDSWPGSWC